MNLEIELDWIDEESNFDESVKQQVIDSIVRKIEGKINADIEKKVNSIIDEGVVNRVNNLTEKLFNDFLNRSVNITDRYGDIIKSYDSVESLIKQRFDNFMTQTVDDKGRTHNGAYGVKHERIVYIVDKQLKEFANEFTTNAVSKVSEEIKTHVQNGLTEKLGKELMTVLKVDKMLKIE